LRKLDLSKNQLGRNQCLPLLAALSSPVCTLQDLKLRDNNLDDIFGVKLLQAMGESNTLYHVSLDLNPIKYSCISEIEFKAKQQRNKQKETWAPEVQSEN
jgi:hypothetical protein